MDIETLRLTVLETVEAHPVALLPSIGTLRDDGFRLAAIECVDDLICDSAPSVAEHYDGAGECLSYYREIWIFGSSDVEIRYVYLPAEATPLFSDFFDEELTEEN